MGDHPRPADAGAPLGRPLAALLLLGAAACHAGRAPKAFECTTPVGVANIHVASRADPAWLFLTDNQDAPTYTFAGPLPDGSVIALGDDGSAFRTTDDGCHWSPESSPPASGVWSFGQVDGTLLGAAVNGPSLLSSRDSGRTWDHWSAAVRLGGAPADGGDGLYALGESAAWRSTDGGREWSLVATLPDATLGAPETWFMTPGGGHWLAAAGSLWLSTDKGASWRDLGGSLPAGEATTGLSFQVVLEADGRTLDWLRYGLDGGLHVVRGAVDGTSWTARALDAAAYNSTHAAVPEPAEPGALWWLRVDQAGHTWFERWAPDGVQGSVELGTVINAGGMLVTPSTVLFSAKWVVEEEDSGTDPPPDTDTLPG